MDGQQAPSLRPSLKARSLAPQDGDSNFDCLPRRARFEQRIDEAVDLERLRAADHRLALFVDGIEKIRDDCAMPVVREGHQIGAGTARAVFALHLGDAPNMMRHDKTTAGE